MKFHTWVIIITIVLTSITGAFADVPNQINFQGTLTDSVGNPVNDNQQLLFEIYTDSVGGSSLWSETHPSVEVTDGLFHVVLGSVTGLPASIFDDTVLWLETTVEEDVLSPRTKLVTVPYGFKSNNADQATWAESTEYATYADTAYYSAVSMPDADWAVSADTIYHLNGNVGIGTAYPTEKLDVNGTVKMTGFQMTGVRSAGDVLTSDENGVGTWQPPTGGGEFSLPYADSVSGVTTAFWIRNDESISSGIAIWGGNNASGNYGYIGSSNRAIYASSDSGHAIEGFSYGSGFAGYFDGKMYISGNVGIGTEYPSEKLDVNGTARLTGFKMPTGASNGYVLTSDGSGTGTWQEASGGGFSLPFSDSVDVAGNGFSVRNVSTSYGAIGVYGENDPNGNFGYLGHSLRGVYGFSDNDHAVEGYSYGPGFAGYFTGKMYASGNVGIGTETPSEMLDVNGTARLTGLKMPTGASSGYVLTSDGSGTGTWQPPAAGFSLPYSGSDATDDASFEVTNTSTGGNGIGIKGVGVNGEYGYLGGDSVGVYGSSSNYDYAGYFDGRVKVTQGLTVDVGATIRYNSAFGNALDVRVDHSSGTCVYATNDYPDVIAKLCDDEVAVYGYSHGNTGILGNYTYGVFGSAASPDHAGYFNGDVYVSNQMGIGTETPEQQLDVYGDAYIGGGSTAHDGLDEILRIRGLSDDWTIGVTNEASASATDLYIGTSGEDGKFHIENGGDVGVGTNNPTAKLDVNGDVKLGSGGSIFLEMREITGTTASTGAYTDISYPAGYTYTNTRILSLEIHYAGATWMGLGNDKGAGGDPFSYTLFYDFIRYNHGDYYQVQDESYRMILMKMP